MNPFSLSFLKGPSLLALFSVPLFSISFFSSNGKTDPFKLSEAKGLTTRVRLYIDGLPKELNKLTQTTTSSGGSWGASNSYQIMQVNSQPHQVSTSGQQQNKKVPALIAELSLKNLNRLDWQKFCLPEGSILKKKQPAASAAAASASASSSSSSQSFTPCNPEWVGYSREENIEVIKHLLHLLTRYIQVEHVGNMMSIYDKETGFEKKENGGRTRRDSSSGNGLSQKLQTIKTDCSLETDDPKKLLDELFFTTSWKRKKCLLAPTTMKVTLDLSASGLENNVAAVQQQSQQTNEDISSKITKEVISKGNFSGNLNYSLFDYWANIKKIESKVLLFKFDSKRKYSLKNAGTCQLEEMYKLVEERSVKNKKEFEDKCPPSQRKSRR
ncbi:hypothetical protein [Mycoplasma suis]|uniref:Uncharacterized protein n=1 Tax=Mycoplasma suis (strain Illinois) TaxID=768700 RepID=F0QRD7_MYCSL|nr:hypothetical protein [Mycoplasma suis]ADX98057.1 hypothetical protein MSU_0523 [Mycoplasma suis str. Illinois]